MSDEHVFGPFRLDTTRATLLRDERPVRLRPQVYDLLVYFAAHPGRVIAKQELFDQVWKGTAVTDDALVQCVMDLRRALGDDGPAIVQTVPRRGYLFEPPPPAVPASAPAGLPVAVGERAAAAPGTAAASGPAVPPPRLVSRRATAVAGVLLVLTVATVWAMRHAARGTPAPIRSIAVLPLANLSGDPSQEYLADGLTDELITDLAQLGTLSVISRTSVMRFKGTSRPLPEVAHDLGCDALIEGSMRRSGQRIRVTAQLVDGRTDLHVWARTFDGDLGDVLTIQSQMARAIAAEVRAELTPAVSARLAARPRVDPAAEEAYLRGTYHVNKGTEAEIARGLEYFREAIDRNPGDAQSQAGLALAYLAQSDYYVPPVTVLPKAAEAALAAIAADDQRAEAHMALGAVRFLYDWNWTEAEAQFRRAIDLNPGSADAHTWYAVFLAQMGRAADARGEIERAKVLDPLSFGVRVQAGWVAYLARADEEARAEWQTAREFEPSAAPSHTSIWAAYLPASDFTAALADVPAPDDGLALAARLGSLVAAGRSEEAARALVDLTALSRRAYVCPYELATAACALGDNETALRWLEHVTDEQYGAGG